MVKPKLLLLGALLMMFAFGFAGGMYFAAAPTGSGAEARTHSLLGATSSSEADSPGNLPDNTLLSSRVRTLNAALAQAKQDAMAAQAGRMTFFTKYHDELRVPALRGDEELSPEMAEILGLSKEEQQAVNNHLASISVALTKLDNANEFLAKQDDTGVTIETPADPKGKALRDELVNSLTADIGGDRASFLMSYLPAYSSSNALGGFSESKKDLEITWVNQGGKLLYTIKNQYYNVKGEANSAGWYTTPTLPQEYQKYFSTDATTAPAAP